MHRHKQLSIIWSKNSRMCFISFGSKRLKMFQYSSLGLLYLSTVRTKRPGGFVNAFVAL